MTWRVLVMFKVTRLLSFRPDLDDAARDALRTRFDAIVAGLPHVLHRRNRPSLPGSVNGGDIICHLQFATEADHRACALAEAWGAFEDFCRGPHLASAESVMYRQGALGLGQPGIAGGVHRILLLSVRPFISEAKVIQFEAEMREMARYIPAIRNWGLSRVTASSGSRNWTHVWEQEFVDVQGLYGPYMMHPIHFAHIDRWFDTQSHDWIVDPELCSTCCEFDTSAMAPMSNASP